MNQDKTRKEELTLFTHTGNKHPQVSILSPTIPITNGRLPRAKLPINETNTSKIKSMRDKFTISKTTLKSIRLNEHQRKNIPHDLICQVRTGKRRIYFLNRSFAHL